MAIIKNFSLTREDETRLQKLIKKHPTMQFSRLINNAISMALEFGERNKFAPPFTEASPESWIEWLAKLKTKDLELKRTHLEFIRQLFINEDNKRKGLERYV